MKHLSHDVVSRASLCRVQKHRIVKKCSYSLEFAVLTCPSFLLRALSLAYLCTFQISFLLLHRKVWLIIKKNTVLLYARLLIDAHTLQYVHAPSVTQVVHMPW